MGAPVLHFEVGGRDAGRLQQFYGTLFDWKIDANNAMNYGIVDNAGQGINGGISPSQDGKPWVCFYVGVADLQAALNKAESLGGKTIMPPTDVPEGPSIAMFADPEGNHIGLLKNV